MPLQRRLPKRGFRNPFRHEVSIVNLQQLESRFDGSTAVDPEAMLAVGLVRKGRPIKILAQGELTKPLAIKAHAFSKTASERISAAGGSAEVVASRLEVKSSA